MPEHDRARIIYKGSVQSCIQVIFNRFILDLRAALLSGHFSQLAPDPAQAIGDLPFEIIAFVRPDQPHRHCFDLPLWGFAF